VGTSVGSTGGEEGMPGEPCTHWRGGTLRAQDMGLKTSIDRPHQRVSSSAGSGPARVIRQVGVRRENALRARQSRG